MAAPLTYVAGKDNWSVVMICGILCICLCLGVLRFGNSSWDCMPKLYCLLQCLWIAIILGEVMRWTVECWPSAEQNLSVPLTVLVLSVFASWNGAERASRTGGILFWFLCLLYAVIVASGVHNLKVEYLSPRLELPEPALLTIFLLPAIGAFLPCENKGRGVWLLVIPVIAVLLTVWTTGSLSQGVCDEMPLPFYEFSKSLSLFGVVERFEAFVSVALTVGFVSVQMLLLSAVHQIAESGLGQKGKQAVIFAALIASGIHLSGVAFPELIYPFLSVLLWVLVPVLTRKRFLKKSRKF